jgi:hypothetical protein
VDDQKEQEDQRDETFLQPFAVVGHVGEPQTARTHQGKVVNREKELFVIEWGAMIQCTPYDNHFIYETDEPNQSAYMCTCGSPAVVIPPGPEGIFVCLFHAEHQRHVTSEVNIRDFEAKAAGRILQLGE